MAESSLRRTAFCVFVSAAGAFDGKTAPVSYFPLSGIAVSAFVQAQRTVDAGTSAKTGDERTGLPEKSGFSYCKSSRVDCVLRSGFHRSLFRDHGRTAFPLCRGKGISNLPLGSGKPRCERGDPETGSETFSRCGPYRYNGRKQRREAAKSAATHPSPAASMV